MRSRLKTNVKKQSLHIIFGIGALLLVLILFGTQLLIGFSTFIEILKGNDETRADDKTVSYISPPFLDPLPDATNKERIDVSGTTITDDVSVRLYLNGDAAMDTIPSRDQTFIFKDVLLKKGENNIKAKVVTKDKKESGFSNILHIKYEDKEPLLEVNNPINGQVFKKDQSPIRISGKTDPNTKVTVNDFWAITDDTGEFYYLYSLKDGDNPLKIMATDEAGNKIIKEISIKVE